MACPFARFTRSLGIDSDSDDDSTSSASTSKLTTQLKDGTWEIHREIEKSPGVRALMGSFHAGSSLQLDRLSHLRFLIMLASVYLAMEAVLIQQKTVLSDMMPLLARSKTLLEDIQIHLDEIMDSEGAQICQIDAVIDEEATSLHESIFSQLRTAQAILIQAKILDANTPLMTLDHVALLDRRQSEAISNYTTQLTIAKQEERRLRRSHKDEGISFTSLSTPQSSRSASSTSLSRDALALNDGSGSDLILSHAYVRYMGDLSGGQHIVKRLSKLFPIYYRSDNDAKFDEKAGFSFYHFDSKTGKTSIELKSMIRSRLDSIVLSKAQSSAMVEEARLAFALNGKLLDSLVDEDSSIDSFDQHSSSSLALTFIRHPSYLAYFVPLAVTHPHSLATLAAVLALGAATTMYAISA